MKNSTYMITGAILFVLVPSVGFILVPVADIDVFKTSILASVHLLTLALGLSGLFLRGIYLRHDLTQPDNLKRLFAADNAWGIGSLLWIMTGIMRAFGGFEKGTDFYMHNPMFHAKLGLFGLAGLLEIWPMITFIRWRVQIGKKQNLNFNHQKTFELINFAETILIILAVFVAGLMARGIFS